MKERVLSAPVGYDAVTQPMVASFAAQLDDQLTRLKREVEELSLIQLEWQPYAGMNTIGMLLAHLAVVELFWINVATKEIQLETDGDNLILSILGIRMDDDGLPLKPDDLHPATLKGRPIENYLAMLDAARARVHSELHTWRDSELQVSYMRGENRITREWTVYHVLEHFASHSGQILLIKHMMRDRGILEKEATKPHLHQKPPGTDESQPAST